MDDLFWQQVRFYITREMSDIHAHDTRSEMMYNSA
jgi:hypothetical protein